MEPTPTPTFEALINQGSKKRRKQCGCAVLATALILATAVAVAIFAVYVVMKKSMGKDDTEGRENVGGSSGFEGGGGGRVKFYQDIKDVKYENQVLLLFGGENGSLSTFSDVDTVEVFMGKGGRNDFICNPIVPRHLFPEVKNGSKVGQKGSFSYKTGLMKQAVLGSCLAHSLSDSNFRNHSVQCKTYDRYRKTWVVQEGKEAVTVALQDPSVGISAGQLLLIPKRDGSFFAYNAYQNHVLNPLQSHENDKILPESCIVYLEGTGKLLHTGGINKDSPDEASNKFGALKVLADTGTIKRDSTIAYPQMIYARRQHGCGMLRTGTPSKTLLLVAGGITSLGGYTNTAEVFTIPDGKAQQVQKWRELRPLNRRRWNFPAVGVIGQSLYVVGGRDGDDAMGGALDTAERYDPIKQEWVEDAKLSSPRARFSSALVDISWCKNLQMVEEQEGEDEFVFSNFGGGLMEK